MNEIFLNFMNGVFSSMEFQIVIRLLLALICGGFIGVEREIFGHAAGLRTHILVCIGAALTMLVSMYGFNGVGDPSRLAAQVISGIGFLGAGTIIQTKGDVKGLTTAASLWVAATIGLACGNGFYLGAIVTTAFAVIVLPYFKKIESKIGKMHNRITLIVKVDVPILQRLSVICQNHGMRFIHVESNVINYEEKECIRLSLIFSKKYGNERLSKLLEDINEKIKPHNSFIDDLKYKNI